MQPNPLPQNSKEMAAKTHVDIFEVLQKTMENVQASVQARHSEIERPLVLYVPFDEYPFQRELMCGSTTDEEVTDESP